ncbi:MAG: DNA polymerase I [Pseudomonadota bacterium]|nr:DNA polymerase I [Pseudomonadota bacterium]
MTQQTVVLVDGSGYLYRAFHALPPLTNTEGKPTGAIYGVMNMLSRLDQDYRDSKIVVVFDPPGPTKRHQIFSEYKANRSKMPDDLALQIEPLHRLIKAKGYPLCVVPEQEADDVIGTLARLYVDQGHSVVICTGDKDFAQLVCDDIVLLDTMRNRLLDVSGVQDKFGVRPDQIIDYLALVGDASDNIPGVMKVGPKTAVKWLNEYASLEGVVENSGSISGKVGEYLRSSLEDLPLYRSLVTICQHVELPFDWSQLHRSPQDVDVVSSSYEDLGFKTWLKELKQNEPVFEKDCHIIQSLAELKEVCSSFLPNQAVGLAFFEEKHVDCAGKSVIKALSLSQEDMVYTVFCWQQKDNTNCLALDDVMMVFRDVLFGRYDLILQDCKVLLKQLVLLSISVPLRIYDLSVMAYGIQGPGRIGIEDLYQSYCDALLPSRDDVLGKGAKRLAFVDIACQVCANLLGKEALALQQIYAALSVKFWQNESVCFSIYRDVDGPLIEVLSEMEIRGVLLDVALLKEQSEKITTRLSELNQEAINLAGEDFNPASVKQLKYILFEKLGLPVLDKTPKGDPSTSEAVLSELSERFELPKILLEIRTLSKLKSTYVDALPTMTYQNRIYCSFLQTITATGRLSCQNPNLQNIPIRTEEGRAVRKAFVAPSGFKLVSFDYSQIELRIMAHISKDPCLMDAFLTGKDVHNSTAGELFSMDVDDVGEAERRVAKTINFGLIYGMSAFGLAKQLGVDRQMAQAYIDRYFHRYPGVKSYMERVREQATTDGYVETVLGRRIFLPDINHQKVSVKKAAQRSAINAPMQGTAAELIKLAMIRVHQLLKDYKDSCYLIIQVHDELVFEIREDMLALLLPKIRDIMCQVVNLDVPLLVNEKVGDNWGEMG